MGCYLDNYKLSNEELAYFIIIPAYALRHWEKGASNWLHYVVALIESLPVLGPVAATIEGICHCIFDDEEPSSSTLYFVQNDQICRTKKGKTLTYTRGKVIGNGQGATVYSLDPSKAKKKAKAVKWFKKDQILDQISPEKQIFFSNIVWPKKVPGVLIPKALLNVNDETVMIMPFCDGTLGDKITTLSEAEQISAIDQLIQAVVELHTRNTLHGEIKLDNILFKTKQGDTEYFLTDFGAGGVNGNLNIDIYGLRGVIRSIILKEKREYAVFGPILENHVSEPLKQFNNSIERNDSIADIQRKWKSFNLC